MARKLRIEYAGAIYHVMNRGDRREAIFADDQDRERFLETLAEACQKTGWQIHAYCLMSNHLHLVSETPQPNLVAGMKWLLGTYTSRYHRRHKEFGHLLSGRYKALVVEGSGDGYLKTVCDYVHLNPARAKLLARQQPLSDFGWSSYRWYLAAPRQRPHWLGVDRRAFGDGQPGVSGMAVGPAKAERPGPIQTTRPAINMLISLTDPVLDPVLLPTFHRFIQTVADGFRQFLRLEGFGQKVHIFGNGKIRTHDFRAVAAHVNYFQFWHFLPEPFGQVFSGHAIGHHQIGQQQTDFGPVFPPDLQRFNAGGCFENAIAKLG